VLTAKKQVPMAMNQYVTTEELLEVVFSVIHAKDVAMQQRTKHISAAMNQHSTIEEMLETVFST
jgi:alkylhydroperoxidase/carboxymuconolactone decarboxylase family protein YurZ